MKGLVLAGGTGSRLFPVTKGTVKQLQRIYNKPMIYYPVSTLIQAGIRKILIITRPEDEAAFKILLGDGSEYGLSFDYAVQPEPKGLAQAFIIAEDFLKGEAGCLVLGDNLFHGDSFKQEIKIAAKSNKPTIFGTLVENQTSFGVVQINPDTHIAHSIEEKPKENKVNGYAVPGIYFFPSDVCEVAKNVKPSLRGELEITSIIEHYLNKGELNVKLMLDDVWLDTGTFESLDEASDFVKIIEKNKKRMIGSIEVEALKQGFMSIKLYEDKIKEYEKSGYGKALAWELELIKTHKIN